MHGPVLSQMRRSGAAKTAVKSVSVRDQRHFATWPNSILLRFLLPLANTLIFPEERTEYL